jgi:ABC-2 type transport system permease protein
VETMPAWLRAVAMGNPVTYSVDAIRALALGVPVGAALPTALVLVGLIALSGAAIAYWRTSRAQ